MSEDRIELMARQVAELHTVILGLDGQGGLHRQVQQLQADVDYLQKLTAKATGIVAAVSAAASFAAAKIWEHMSGK